jgi:hypothetical protein
VHKRTIRHNNKNTLITELNRNTTIYTLNIILHYIFKNIYGRARTGLIWLRTEKKWFDLVNVVMKLRAP